MVAFLRLAAVLSAVVAGPVALAQQTLYGQCGGIGWTGPTECVAGACCTYVNDWYSQCLAGNCQPSSGGGTTTTTKTSSPATTTTTSVSQQPTGNFNNPVLWEDLADNDVFRVGDTYYYTASNMHYSPGAPILRSYDLANWEYIGHAVPKLDWSSKYDLTNGQRAYIKGTWASTMRYRKSNGLFYFIACIEFGTTYVYTASNPAGPWTQRGAINTCFYDAGLLIDEDTDTMYVAYGNTQISVAQLSSDGFSLVKSQTVYSSSFTIEGSRFYKKDGKYYIFVTQPANAQHVLSASSPFGSYSIKQVVYNIGSPVSGSGYPHQGSLVETQNGNWYYMAFIDAYPGGRIPVLAPVTWQSGWPVVTTVNGGWGASYPYTLPKRTVASTTGTDTFASSALSPMYEWNHNPDTTKFSVGSGLKLSTASITYDLYQARNTLTRRIHGPQGTATVELDFSNMADGDRAGLVLLRDNSTWIGIKNDGGVFTLCVVNGIVMNSDWTTLTTGSTSASQSISKGKVWLRGTANIQPGGSRQASFSYSTDGSNFQGFGPAFTMGNDWHFFMGYRWGLFNYATKALGGSVAISSFTSV